MKEIPQASEISNEIQGNGRKLVIFDWDDTLFPTTVLKQYVEHTSLIAYFRHRYSQALSLLDQSLINLFNELRDHNQSEIIILSNATQAWLDYTFTFLPMFNKYLKTSGLRVVSAQDQ